MKNDFVKNHDGKESVEASNGQTSSAAPLRAILVELGPIEPIVVATAMERHQPVGLLEETFQGLRSTRPGKPSHPISIQQQTVKHPPNQFGLGDPELPRSRLKCPLVLVAYV